MLERLMLMDSVTLMSKGQLNVAELISDGWNEDTPFDQPILRSLMDVDVVRKKGNEACHDVVAVLKEKNVEMRRTALAELDQKWLEPRRDSQPALCGKTIFARVRPEMLFMIAWQMR